MKPEQQVAHTKPGILPGELPLFRFRLRFRARERYEIRGYRGSAWRGVLGRALKQLVCIRSDRDCRSCLVAKSCTYPYVFETPGEIRGETGGLETAPHPYVLAAEPCWEPRMAEVETVEVTLFGGGVRAWAYVLHALQAGAARGLGKERVPLSLTAAEQEGAKRDEWFSVLRSNGALAVAKARTPTAPPVPEAVRIRFLTPLRIRRENDLVEPERLGFDEFVAAVLRRLALVTRFHAEQPWQIDIPALNALARRALVLERELGWQDWARYSNRQHRPVPMGGVVGQMTVAMAGMEELWPWLWLGQWTHAGKGTVMGLGRYELEAL